MKPSTRMTGPLNGTAPRPVPCLYPPSPCMIFPNRPAQLSMCNAPGLSLVPSFRAFLLPRTRTANVNAPSNLTQIGTPATKKGHADHNVHVLLSHPRCRRLNACEHERAHPVHDKYRSPRAVAPTEIVCSLSFCFFRASQVLLSLAGCSCNDTYVLHPLASRAKC